MGRVATPSARAVPISPIAFARSNRSRYVSELKEFVRIPSVSADPGRRKDVDRCARWLAGRLRRAGLEAGVTATEGHPMVIGRWHQAPGRPTVLIYGHYDVRSPGPTSKWRSPPFEPEVRGGALYGRGASDDKGQLFAHVLALEAMLQTTGSLPVNVLCLFEGEEEVGSPSLVARLANDPSEFGADVAIMSDTPMLDPGKPAITYSLRGRLVLDVDVERAGGDVHSGMFAGAIPDATLALCCVLGGLRDRTGRVAVPGFYDRVIGPGSHERQIMARVGPSDLDIARNAGADRVTISEPGFTAYEVTTLRPALTVTRVSGGQVGSISCRASASVDIRLVPDQRPGEIQALVSRHLAQQAPSWARVRISSGTQIPPVTVDRTHPAVRAAVEAYVRGFGSKPAFLRSGGTVPVVSGLQRALGIPVVMMGFALMDDRMHAPNEKFRLSSLFQGIETVMWFLVNAVSLVEGGAHDR